MLRVVFLIVGLSLLIYLVFALGPGEVLALLARIGWGFLPIAALYAGYQALRAWALRLCVARRGLVRYRDALAVRVSGEALQFLTSTGPFLAEPAKALLLRRRGLTTTEGFAATIAEYLVYTFVSAAMLAGGMAYLLARAELGGALHDAAVVLLVSSLVFLSVAAVAIARRIYLIGGVLGRIARLPGVRARAALDPSSVRRMEDWLLEVLRERPGRFVVIALVEIAAHAVLVGELWWILWMSEVGAGFLDALVLEAAGKFTTLAFFFIPAQLGAAEGVNAVLFRTLGFSSAAGVGVALARRVRSVLLAAVGLAVLALLTRRREAA